jgi:hypothetical protein
MFKIGLVKKLLHIVPFVLVLLITACNTSTTAIDETSDTATVEKEAATGVLKFVVQEFKQQLTPGCDSCPQVTAAIPVAAGNKPVAQKINDSVLAIISKTIGEEGRQFTNYDSLFGGFIDSYKKMKAELPDANFGWEATIKGNVVQQSDSLINIKLETFVFTGGAHPNTNTFSLLFDPVTGNKLSIVNLVTNLHTLTRLAEVKFRKQYKIPANASINSTGFTFDDKRFILPRNIFFNSDGLLLHYNAYDVGPYVMGAQ